MKFLKDFGDLLPLLRPGTRVVLHSGCAEPPLLASELARHAPALQDVHVYTLMPMGAAPYARPGAGEYLNVHTFFPGKGLREAANTGRTRVIRVPLSEIPGLFASGTLRADLLFLQLAPPDREGRMSLGVSVDYMRAILATNPVVVAEINPEMPWTCGDTVVFPDQVDYVLESAGGAPEPVIPVSADGTDRRIAENVASLIPQGAALQMGIGSVPDLVLEQLAHMKGLRVHSGIVTDQLMPLLRSGAVSRAVSTMAAGTPAFYNFLHLNEAVEFHPCSYTHNHSVLASIPRLCAINSVLQVDLSGRANAEQVDGRIIASPGGLPDFARGACASPGGKSIIALRAASRDGRRSNILPQLPALAPVTATADCIDFVVTEYGVARLRGLSLQERSQALIAIAHPDHRGYLQTNFAW